MVEKEWVSLAEMAGKPVIRWLIQMLRGAVRNSILNTIKVEAGSAYIARGWGYCIILQQKLVSKTPAKLKVIGFDYWVYQGEIMIQSGYWRRELPKCSIGYPMKVIEVSSKDDVLVDMGVNPLILRQLPDSNKNWKVEGVLQIQTAYGVIHKTFETRTTEIVSDQEWGRFISEIKVKLGENRNATS